MKFFIAQLSLFLWYSSIAISAQSYSSHCVVSKDGTGDFTTITDAINALPTKTFQRYIIYIKDGVYNEKIRLELDNITLKGESKEGTIIEYNQLKKDWDNNRDYIGAAVVNICADDIILDNITIKNSTPKIGPTAYVVFGTGTRTIIQNCQLLGNGANSVSLMDYKNGLYYLNNCSISGTVDFMRAMGWCYIENCQFYQKEAIASIWHGAIRDANQKMVLKNCQFDGTEHFFIGRHHYDAQFILIGCHFTERLADLNIYRKEYPKAPQKEFPYSFGDRHYFFDCHRDGGDYAWMKDNLEQYNPKLKPEEVNAAWTFDNRWQPETTQAPICINSSKNDSIISFTFDQPLSVYGDLKLKSASGDTLIFNKGKGRAVLTFICKKPLSKKDLKGYFEIISGSATTNSASTTVINLPSPFKK